MKSKLLILLLLTLILGVCNLFWGTEHIPAEHVLRILRDGDRSNMPYYFIVMQHRLPQALTAALTGASLGVGGLLLQTAFRNPLAGPSILGIDSGSNLGVAVVMLLLGGSVTMGNLTMSGYLLVIVAAMLGAWLIMILLLTFVRVVRNQVMLLITGIMISYVAGSLITLLSSRASEQGIVSYISWGMGSFIGVTMERLPLYASLCGAGLLMAMLMAKPLDALLLGDNYARNLGFSIRRTRTQLLLATGLLTATTTAFCGPITFIGLAVPHLTRLVTGACNHRFLLPATMLTGASLMLLCNLFCCLPAPQILHINVITPIIGAPVVIWVIIRKR